MIAALASLLSLLWVAFAFGYIPGPGGSEADGGLWVALAIDVIVLVLGITAVVLAVRGRYPWPVAIVFALAPVVHLIGSFFGEIRILFFFVPCLVVVGASIAYFIHRYVLRSPKTI
jgi:hypothetical protein